MTALSTVTYISAMDKVAVDNISGYFLNHKRLIDKALNKEQNSCIFQLKSDLFVFTEKEKLTGESKKRRKNAKKSSDSTTIESSNFLNIEHVAKCATSLVTSCQQRFSPEEKGSTVDINSIMEDSSEFPTLRGANNLNNPIVTTYSNREILLPQKCTFYNDDIRNLTRILPKGELYDFVVLDPPWRNKYIRRLKSARAELSYKMLYNEELADIPLELLTHQNSLVVIWCTNSSLHHRDVLEKFLPKWNLKLVATWYWIKLNHKGELIGPFKEAGQKQPFEHIFIATHENNNSFNFKEEFVISVASVIHSHKPPLYDLFKECLPDNPKCLELFARYLYPGFTSVGLEVLKLQDTRFYNIESKNK